MKAFFTILAIAATMCSCNTTAQETQHSFIKPLPSGINIDSLTDATLPASFTSDDFNWMGGNLTMTIYTEDLYDVVELHQMQIGDTILYNNDTIVVKKIERKDSFITVNDGLNKGGAWLTAYEGGTYRASQFDDHSLFTEIGKVEIPLSDDFTIEDCGDNPTDPTISITKDQKLYLERLKDYKRSFTNLNTTVRIEHGLITNITRKWIP